MPRPLCWIIDNYEYRECNNPAREFRMPVSLHGHSYHSEENIGRLNYVMKLPVLNLINDFFPIPQELCKTRHPRQTPYHDLLQSLLNHDLVQSSLL